MKQGRISKSANNINQLIDIKYFFECLFFYPLSGTHFMNRDRVEFSWNTRDHFRQLQA